MAASDRIERAERTMFQLLLQQIMVVLEVPKIGFKICLIFSYKDSNFWYFSCICEATSKVVQGLSTNAPLQCFQKTSENLSLPDIFSRYK